jgi:phospholipase C
VHAGQQLVLAVYRALAASPAWPRSLLVIVYDEHGGLYDHVEPGSVGPAPDDDPRFRSYGVRVPALVISPWSQSGFVSSTVFDHASIIKTILLRFCARDGKIPNMGRRVTAANDLSALLSADARRDPPDAQALVQLMADRGAEIARANLIAPPAEAARPQRPQLDEFQTGMLRGAQHLRRRKLPAGRP